MKNDSFSIRTLGCKVNSYNSRLIRENLLRAGLREEENPGIMIINGCLVTLRAQRKTRQAVNSCLKTGARVIVTGCYAAGANVPPGALSLPGEREVVRLLSGGKEFRRVISSYAPRTRAFVKVQQGCPGKCSYCVVPMVRGRPFSRDVSEVLEETRLVSPLHPEIVLTGTHLGLFRGRGGEDLAELLEKVLENAPCSRVRLSSLEITEITPRLLSLFAHPRLCRHLHVPLQSGSDRILRLMKRPYTKKDFLEKLWEIRHFEPEISFTTDVMAGFPGESTEDARETADAVEKAGFLRAHVFPYSPREGTEAFAMGDDIPAREKDRRARQIRKAAKRASLRYRRRFLNREKTVIAEPPGRRGLPWGYTGDYIPVFIEKANPAPGSVCEVRITGADEESTRGVLLRYHQS